MSCTWQWHNADGAINDTTEFFMLKWLEVFYDLVLVVVPVPCATDNAFLVMECQMASHNQKSNIASEFNCLDLRNVMVPLITLLALWDASVCTNGITWPKSHVAPHFDHLDLRNAVVWLMMPLAPCCAHAKGITWPKHHVASQCYYLHLKNTVVLLMTPLASGDTNVSAGGTI